MGDAVKIEKLKYRNMEVPENQNNLFLQTLANFSVSELSTTAPPTDPADESYYIVGSGATGEWAGKDGLIAYYALDKWVYLEPEINQRVNMGLAGGQYFWNGTAWLPVPGGGGGGGGSVNSVNGKAPDAAGNVALTKSDFGLENVDNTSDADKPISTTTQTALDSLEAELNAGISGITKESLGLGNVNNTSDANKPVSTQTQAALDALEINVSASLADVTAKIPAPSNATPKKAAGSGFPGTSISYTREDHIHPINTASDIGLGNVDNTSDVDKPISTAAQAEFTSLGSRMSSAETKITQSEADIVNLKDQMEKSAHFRGFVSTTAELANIPNPVLNDFASNAETGTVWIYNGTEWEDSLAPVPDKTVEPYDSIPSKASGTGSAGDSNLFARGNHIHPINTPAETGALATSDAGVVVPYLLRDTINFWLDAVNGNDNNDGMAPERPFKTSVAFWNYIAKTASNIQRFISVNLAAGDYGEIFPQITNATPRFLGTILFQGVDKNNVTVQTNVAISSGAFIVRNCTIVGGIMANAGGNIQIADIIIKGQSNVRGIHSAGGNIGFYNIITFNGTSYRAIDVRLKGNVYQQAPTTLVFDNYTAESNYVIGVSALCNFSCASALFSGSATGNKAVLDSLSYTELGGRGVNDAFIGSGDALIRPNAVIA